MTVVLVSRRTLVAVLVACLTLALLLSAGRSEAAGTGSLPQAVSQQLPTFTPVTGATFNRPIGTASEQRRVFHQVIRTIDAVPGGEQIRIAVFSFADRRTADALLRAVQRGVSVQMVFDDHTIFRQEARLRDELGTDTAARSFVRFCSHSCRGTSGDMHDKIFLFSKAGSADYVTMVGSNNMTSFNAERQWSDVYTIVDSPSIYSTYGGVFAEVAAGIPLKDPFLHVDAGGYRSQFYPRAPGSTDDAVARTLSQVSSTGALGRTGVHGHTLIRIAMHAWFGPRGLFLAKHVAALSRAGCVVQVVPGVSVGPDVRRTLTSAGAQLAQVRHPTIRTHQKVLQISGLYAGHRRRLVLTGSHNWTDWALRCDDVVLRVRGAAAAAQYAADFQDMWDNG